MPPPAQRTPRPHGSNGHTIDGTGTGPRHALAQAIAMRDAAQSDLARAEQALQQAQRAQWQAADELEQAEQALEQAREAAGIALADSLVSGMKSNGHGLVRDARTRAQDAADHLASVTVAETRLSAAIPERHKELERASYEVIKAARNVVRAEAPDLAAELKAAIERVCALRAQVFWLFRNAALPSQPERRFESDGLPHLNDSNEDSEVAQLLRQAEAGRGFDERHPAFAAWAASFAALAKDAEAKLPAIHGMIYGRAGN
jgi:hypothetical protein